MLLVVAVIAVPLAWIAKERRQSQHEQQLADELRKHGFDEIWLGSRYNLWDYDQNKPQSKWRQLAGQVLGERVMGVFGNKSDLDDLTAVTELTKLQRFGLDETKLSDLTPIADLTNLHELWISHSQVNDLAALAGLKNLQDLVIFDSSVSDLRPLGELKNLRHLAVSDSPQVRDVTPLAGLHELFFLQLDGTNADIAPLASLTSLQSLTLNRTPVSDLSPLAGLANLEDLALNETQVTDLTPLAGLKKLINVELTGTRVSKEQVDALRKALPNCSIKHDPFP
jgi:Leucine-rich repeat (LRR) protein